MISINRILLEPTVVLSGTKTCLWQHWSDCQPSISDVVGSAKKLNLFTTQTKPFYNFINFLWFFNGSWFSLLCNNHINIDVRMNKTVTGSFFRLSFITHQTMLFYTNHNSLLTLLQVFFLCYICLYPNNIFTSFVSPCFH